MSECTNTKATILTWALGLVALAASRANAQIVYFAENPSGTIYRADLYDPASPVESLGNHFAGPASLALHFGLTPANIYFAEQTQGEVSRADLEGNVIQAVCDSGMNAPNGVAIHPYGGGRLLATDPPGGAVYLSADTGIGTCGVWDNSTWPLGIATHPSSLLVYWADPLDGTIYSKAIDEGGKTQERPDCAGCKWVAVDPDDPDGGKIYWTTDDSIYRADLGNGAAVALIEGVPGPINGLAVDTSQGWIYWTNNTAVYRAKLEIPITQWGPILTGDYTGLAGIAVFHDCNENNVDDTVDIANGTSLDENGDGIPDECWGQSFVALDDTFDVELGPFQAGLCGSDPPIATGYGNWQVANMAQDLCGADPGLVAFAGGRARLWNPDNGDTGNNGLFHPIPAEPAEWQLTVECFPTESVPSRPVPACYVQSHHEHLWPGDPATTGWAASLGQELTVYDEDIPYPAGYTLSYGLWHTVELINAPQGWQIRAWQTGGKRPDTPLASSGQPLGEVRRILFAGPNLFAYDYSIGRVILEDAVVDCNENGLADACEIADGSALDDDGDGVPNECEGDINYDGVVNTADLLTLLGNWGPCPAPCPADLDGNGIVGTSDLLTLLGNWG